MGMKQRLGIANALLGSPEILLLDEPINGLDPQGIADIRTLIVSLNRKQNMTIIVSSHILGELEHTANKFGFVHQGTVLKEITHDDLRSLTDRVSTAIQKMSGQEFVNEYAQKVKAELKAQQAAEEAEK